MMGSDKRDLRGFEPAGRIFDKPIEDAEGKLVGRVEDVLLDVDSGQIEYVLIALPCRDGRRTETITVPWSLISAETRRRRSWRVGVNQSVLERLLIGRQRR